MNIETEKTEAKGKIEGILEIAIIVIGEKEEITIGDRLEDITGMIESIKVETIEGIEVGEIAMKERVEDIGKEIMKEGKRDITSGMILQECREMNITVGSLRKGKIVEEIPFHRK